jgi:hypothetical protein
MDVHGFFSGIGGFELGFMREGFNIKSMCECDQKCIQILNTRFTQVPVYTDIRSLSAASLVRIFQLQGSKSDEKESGAHSTRTILPLFVRRGLRGLSRRMSATHGEGGCLTCGAAFTASGMPACRYECAPMKWDSNTKDLGYSLLPTPTASSYGSCRGGGKGRVGKWRKSLLSLGIRSPAQWELLMGFPIGWTDARCLEMQSYRSWRRSLEEASK